MNNLLIRADANPNIGMGHIMRCLSIADAATNFGFVVSFVTADDNVRSLIIDRGYKAVILNSDYINMEDELRFWPDESYDVVIVDSYFVTSTYFQRLKSKVGESGIIVYIDDLADFPYPVDILINYNAYADFHTYSNLYSCMKMPRMMLGPTYVPLRSMFRKVELKVQPKKVGNVLISTGGADSAHIALSLVKSFPTKFNYHLLIGAMNSDKSEIERLAQTNEHIILHENVSNMKSLISFCDIAVSAAGSTLYEICACGVPLITYVIADNQILGAETFGKLGLAENLGDVRILNDCATKIITAIEEIASDYKKRVNVGMQMQKMIDGLGADRIIKALLKSNI